MGTGRKAPRVRPPAPDKDWGEVHAGGANRIRHLWGRLLNLYTPWEKLEPKGELVNETESTP